MGKDSKISWCDHTFNPWRGCVKVSAGCARSYAETQSHRNPAVLGHWGPGSARVVGDDRYWSLPVRWEREAAWPGARRRVFCASLADVFEDHDGPLVDVKGHRLWVPSWADANGITIWEPDDATPDFAYRRRWATLDDARARLWALIRATPHLDWLLLTKRVERWRLCWPTEPVPGHVRQNEGDGRRFVKFDNVWMGTSVEDQRTADARIPALLEVPAAVRWLSMEPLLGPVDLRPYLFDPHPHREHWPHEKRGLLHWVVVGGESGSRAEARPFDLRWARDLRGQCRDAGVPYHFKQLGTNPVDTRCVPYVMGRVVDETLPFPIRHPKGEDYDEFPEDLKIREYPETCHAG